MSAVTHTNAACFRYSPLSLITLKAERWHELMWPIKSDIWLMMLVLIACLVPVIYCLYALLTFASAHVWLLRRRIKEEEVILTDDWILTSWEPSAASYRYLNFWLFQRWFNLITYNSCHLSSPHNSYLLSKTTLNTNNTVEQWSNHSGTPSPITVSNHTKVLDGFQVWGCDWI